MTVLNHSCITLLLADLEQHQDTLDAHRGSVFHFRYVTDGQLSAPWRLRSVSRATQLLSNTGLRLVIAYGLGSRMAWQPDESLTVWLENRALTYCDLYDPMVVVLKDEPPQTQPHSNSVDKSLRKRLNKNLRGAFS